MSDSLRSLDLSQLNLDDATRQLLQRLLNHIETLEAENQALRGENQQLGDEIARLKGQKPKPQFKANRPAGDAAGTPPQPPPSSAKPKPSAASRVPRAERIKLDRAEVVPLDRSQLPPDFQAAGYREVVIQNLDVRTDNVCYRLERGSSASTGQFYEASLPPALQGESFGPELQAFVLTLYFELRVPEEKIWELLNAQEIVISAGQISNILIKKHLALFAAERQAILAAGVETTRYQQIDDTALRVKGVNHHLTVLGNPFFACFFIRRHKNWQTVAALFDLQRLDASPDEPAPAVELKALSEAVLILLSDDAGQFAHQTAHHALCWVHAARHFAKLQPYFEAHQQLVDAFRTELWAYYEQLKAYKLQPTETEKARLSQAFDELFGRVTGYAELDHRIALTRANKAELLLVLEFPEVPLENNLMERDLREGVVKRKISSGPRGPDGAYAWEVFLTLLATCRKNGVNFFAYLCDRIAQRNQAPPLAELVRARAPTGF
jgi:Transposase IS66 family